MATFKKILVPVDGSANSMRGLDKAISIAKASDAEITGFYVFHLPLAAGIKYTKKMREEADKKAIAALAPAFQKCERVGAKFKYKTGGGGKTSSQIVDFAKKNKFDMIVIGARGLSGPKEKFLGSTSNHVMHESTVPVLVVK